MAVSSVKREETIGFFLFPCLETRYTSSYNHYKDATVREQTLKGVSTVSQPPEAVWKLPAEETEGGHFPPTAVKYFISFLKI